jgi:hypothetical protein
MMTVMYDIYDAHHVWCQVDSRKEHIRKGKHARSVARFITTSCNPFNAADQMGNTDADIRSRKLAQR